MFNKRTVDLFLSRKHLNDSIIVVININFFHRHGGESEIVGHIERVLYSFQQMTSKIKSIGACEQFCSILKCWFKTVMLKDMQVIQNINATCLNVKCLPPFRKT